MRLPGVAMGVPAVLAVRTAFHPLMSLPAGLAEWAGAEGWSLIMSCLGTRHLIGYAMAGYSVPLS